jgi:hypothetical protein
MNFLLLITYNVYLFLTLRNIKSLFKIYSRSWKV